MNFPRRVFHEQKAPYGVIVTSEAEEKSLGAGWVDSPNKFSAEGRAKVEFEPKEQDVRLADVAVKPVASEKKSEAPELPKKPQDGGESSGGENPGDSSEPVDLDELTKDELIKILVKEHKGNEKALKKLTKGKLIEQIIQAQESAE